MKSNKILAIFAKKSLTKNSKVGNNTLKQVIGSSKMIISPHYKTMTEEERRQFAESVFAHLEADSFWLTLAGNADGAPREIGPPRLTARELVAAVEPCFEIVSLVASHFGSNQPDPPEAWVCLMQKR